VSLKFGLLESLVLDPKFLVVMLLFTVTWKSIWLSENLFNQNHITTADDDPAGDICYNVRLILNHNNGSLRSFSTLPERRIEMNAGFMRLWFEKRGGRGYLYYDWRSEYLTDSVWAYLQALSRSSKSCVKVSLSWFPASLLELHKKRVLVSETNHQG